MKTLILLHAALVAFHQGNFFNIFIQYRFLICIEIFLTTYKLNSAQSLSSVLLFVAPWTAASQVSLSSTNSRSLPKLVSTESVMPSNHLIFCHPLLLPPSIIPSIRVFSNESVLHIRWPNSGVSDSASVLPMNI